MARWPKVVVLAAAVLLVVALVPADAQADEEPEGEDWIEVVGGALPLADLLRAISNLADLPLVWDARDRSLQGRTLYVQGSILKCRRHEILDGLRSLLSLHGLVLVPTGMGENRRILVLDVRRVQAMVKPGRTFVELHDGNLGAWAEKDGVFITTFLRVEHLQNLTDLEKALRGVVTGANVGQLLAVPEGRGFFVRDFAPRVVEIYKVVRSLDKPFAGPTPEAGEREVIFRAIGLKHARATDVAALLVLTLGANAPRPGPRVLQSDRAGEDVVLVPPLPVLRIQPDDRLQQILVSGMRKDIDRVLEIVRTLDQPEPTTETDLRVVRLQHVDAIGVAEALNRLILHRPDAWAEGALPAVEALVDTNALLLHAHADDMQALGRVIAEMDRPTEAAAAPKDR